MAGRYAVLGDNSVVQNVVVWDGITEWQPQEGSKVAPSDSAQIGWTLGDDGEFHAPPEPPAIPLSNEELVALANVQRDALLVEAGLRISPLQDAVDLGEATADETQLLLNWKRYRVSLNRIDQQAGYPSVIQWPARPV